MGDIKRSRDYDFECQRCFNPSNILFRHYKARDGMTYIYEDTEQPIPENEREDIWLCWDCDWEVMNGRPMEIDAYEIEMDRRQEAYEHDPINNPPPWL